MSIFNKPKNKDMHLKFGMNEDGEEVVIIEDGDDYKTAIKAICGIAASMAHGYKRPFDRVLGDFESCFNEDIRVKNPETFIEIEADDVMIKRLTIKGKYDDALPASALMLRGVAEMLRPKRPEFLVLRDFSHEAAKYIVLAKARTKNAD